MSAADPAVEVTPTRPTGPRDEATSVPLAFRPLVFLLSSLTADNIDAAAVARLLQPHFKAGDFYVINAASFATPNNSPPEGKKAGNNNNGGGVSLSSTPGSTSESVTLGVQNELTRIAAVREEARQTAACAKSAQLTTLQKEYMEDGLSPEEALEAARVDLQERSGSEDETYGGGDGADGDDEYDGRGGGAAAMRRLPPCVCVLNVPLTCSAIDRFARAIPGVAAALLVESRCCVRELVSNTATTMQTGAAGVNDKAKGRGGGAGGTAANLVNVRGGCAYTDDLLEFLGGAMADLSDDGNGLSNVLVQRMEYPTESVDRPQAGSGGAAASSTLRATVSPSYFVSTVYAQLLRIFQCWLRYESWRADRVCVRVPPYIPPYDADAAPVVSRAPEGKSLEEPSTPPLDRRLSRRKNGAPTGSISDTLTTSLSPATTGVAEMPAEGAPRAPPPRSMSEVAAEQFEYNAFMRCWAAGLPPNTPYAQPSIALHACLAACLHQLGSHHGAGGLRSRAEVAAARLQEDVRAAMKMCCAAYAAGSEGVLMRPTETEVAARLVTVEAAALRAAFTASGAPISGGSEGVASAETIEAALSQCIAAGAGGSDALARVSAVVASTVGEGDVAHWLRTALVAREHHGWSSSMAVGRPSPGTAVCCLRRPGDAQRVVHSAAIFRGPTTFPQFYKDEDFLAAEAGMYAAYSSNSASEVEEEEEMDDDAGGLEASTAESESTTSANTNAAVSSEKLSTKAAAAAAPTTTTASIPATPPVDHVAVVMKQLRRRRVFEQVRSSHSRPAVQEMGVPGDRCQAVVTETTWMHAVDGTLIEVSHTVANTCQLRCAVMADTLGKVQVGYMLECTSPATVVAPGNASGGHHQQPQQSRSPESTVESGVRGFVVVGDRLRVFTTVVADNSRAVEEATYAAAIAAAKDAAVAQYDAQFNKAAKATKGREKGSTAAAPLSLEEITAMLLAAVPPPPSLSPASSPAHDASPPRMHVHALFPLHHCVLTPVASRVAVPGVRLALLPESERLGSTSLSYSAGVSVAAVAAATSHPSQLLTVHLWWRNQLCTVPVRRLSAAHFYADGVAELLSPDLPPGVRVVLHSNGSYITEAGLHRLFVSARGRCVLCRSNAAVGSGVDRVDVHLLRSGLAAAVTNAAVCRVEREDGLQQEFIRLGASAKMPAASTTGDPGRLSKTRFGPGIGVYRVGGDSSSWVWRVAGLPAIQCDREASPRIAVALDDAETNCWVYKPDQRIFELHMKDAQSSERDRVVVTLSLSSARLTLWGGATMTSSCASEEVVGGFVVDCAYGGAWGRVGSSHQYRVSPFGRCSAEVAVTQGSTTRWQLVLPPAYKRPKKREPEVVLVPEYANDAFRCAVSGRAGPLPHPGGQTQSPADTKTDSSPSVAVLHLQRDPPPLDAERCREKRGGSERGTEVGAHNTSSEQSDEFFLADTLAPAATTAKTLQPQVRCAAVMSQDGVPVAAAAAMDAVSWAEYARWLSQLPQAALRRTPLPTLGAAPSSHTVPALAFVVEQHDNRSCDFYPLTVTDGKAVSRQSHAAQRYIVLHSLSATSPASQSCWYTSQEVSKALEECRHGSCPPLPAENTATASADDVALQSSETDGTMRAVAPTDPDAELQPHRTTTSPGTLTEEVPDATAARPADCSAPYQLATSPSALNYWSSPCCRLVVSPAKDTVAGGQFGNSNAGDATNSSAAAAAVGAALSLPAAPSAASGAAPASVPPSAPAASTYKKPSASSAAPLMHSYSPARDAQTGTTASSRFHAPALVVQPRHIDFGNVPKGRRYVATFELTNTSSVPCRYRVRLDAAVRPFLAVTYPRHFVAPGITVTVTVELSGWQPHGVVDSELTVVHEGGTTAVGVVWCTTDVVAHSVQMGRNVVCTGWSVSKPTPQHPSKTSVVDGEQNVGNDADSEDSMEVPPV
jgi:hypothetical protein